jgi:hypothetical protein
MNLNSGKNKKQSTYMATAAYSIQILLQEEEKSSPIQGPFGFAYTIVHAPSAYETFQAHHGE